LLKQFAMRGAENERNVAHLHALIANKNISATDPVVRDAINRGIAREMNEAIAIKVTGMKYVSKPGFITNYGYTTDDFGNKVISFNNEDQNMPLTEKLQGYRVIDINGNVIDNVSSLPEDALTGKERKYFIKPVETIVNYPYKKEFRIENRDELNDVATIRFANGKKLNIFAYVKNTMGGMFYDEQQRSLKINPENIDWIISNVGGDSAIDESSFVLRKGFTTDNIADYYSNFINSLFMVANRVPFNGLASGYAVEIIGFDNSSTNVLKISDEVNVTANSDFDIDQWTTTMKNISVTQDKDGNTVWGSNDRGQSLYIDGDVNSGKIDGNVLDDMSFAEMENALFDAQYHVLTDVKNKNFLFNRVSAGELKSIAATKLRNKVLYSNDASTSMEMFVATHNDMIGQFANQLHVLSRLSRLAQAPGGLKAIPGFKNISPDGTVINLDESKLLTDTLVNRMVQFTQASVDNPKELINELLNVNVVSGNVIAASIISGNGIDETIGMITNKEIWKLIKYTLRSQDIDRKTTTLIDNTQKRIKELEKIFLSDEQTIDYLNSKKEQMMSAISYHLGKQLQNDKEKLEKYEKAANTLKVAVADEDVILSSDEQRLLQSYNSLIFNKEKDIETTLRELQKDVTDDVNNNVEKHLENLKNTIELLKRFDNLIVKGETLRRINYFDSLYSGRKYDDYDFYNFREDAEFYLGRTLEDQVTGINTGTYDWKRRGRFLAGVNGIGKYSTNDIEVRMFLESIAPAIKDIPTSVTIGGRSVPIRIVTGQASGFENAAITSGIVDKNNVIPTKHVKDKFGIIKFNVNENAEQDDEYRLRAAMNSDPFTVVVSFDKEMRKKRGLVNATSFDTDANKVDIVERINKAINDIAVDRLDVGEEGIDKKAADEIKIFITGANSGEYNTENEYEKWLNFESRVRNVASVSSVVNNSADIKEYVNSFYKVGISFQERTNYKHSTFMRNVMGNILESQKVPKLSRTQYYEFTSGVDAFLRNMWALDYIVNDPEIMNVQMRTHQGVDIDLNLSKYKDRNHFIIGFPTYFKEKGELNPDIQNNILFQKLNVLDDTLRFDDTFSIHDENILLYTEAFEELKKADNVLGRLLEFYTVLKYGEENKTGTMRMLIGLKIQESLSKSFEVYNKELLSNYAVPTKFAFNNYFMDNFMSMTDMQRSTGLIKTKNDERVSDNIFPTYIYDWEKRTRGRNQKVIKKLIAVTNGISVYQNVYSATSKLAKVIPHNVNIEITDEVIRLTSKEEYDDFERYGRVEKEYRYGHTYKDSINPDDITNPKIYMVNGVPALVEVIRNQKGKGSNRIMIVKDETEGREPIGANEYDARTSAIREFKARMKELGADVNGLNIKFYQFNPRTKLTVFDNTLAEMLRKIDPKAYNAVLNSRKMIVSNNSINDEDVGQILRNSRNKNTNVVAARQILADMFGLKNVSLINARVENLIGGYADSGITNSSQIRDMNDKNNCP